MNEKLLEMIFAAIDLNKLDMLETNSEETRRECQKNLDRLNEQLETIYVN